MTHESAGALEQIARSAKCSADRVVEVMGLNAQPVLRDLYRRAFQEAAVHDATLAAFQHLQSTLGLEAAALAAAIALAAELAQTQDRLNDLLGRLTRESETCAPSH